MNKFLDQLTETLINTGILGLLIVELFFAGFKTAEIQYHQQLKKDPVNKQLLWPFLAISNNIKPAVHIIKGTVKVIRYV